MDDLPWPRLRSTCLRAFDGASGPSYLTPRDIPRLHGNLRSRVSAPRTALTAMPTRREASIGCLERPVIEKILTQQGLDLQPPPRGRAREAGQDCTACAAPAVINITSAGRSAACGRATLRAEWARRYRTRVNPQIEAADQGQTSPGGVVKRSERAPLPRSCCRRYPVPLGRGPVLGPCGGPLKCYAHSRYAARKACMRSACNSRQVFSVPGRLR